MYYDIKETGKRIQALRKLNGYTQEQLAEDIGISMEQQSKVHGTDDDLDFCFFCHKAKGRKYKIVNRERLNRNEKAT